VHFLLSGHCEGATRARGHEVGAKGGVGSGQSDSFSGFSREAEESCEHP
jgi:hypothetical protein